MSSSGGVPYLGSKISLISKSEIRYEGILYTIDTKDSTVALSKVRSFGTEDRPTDRPVAPRDEIYEYIIFRGSDIKDIRVCQPPKPHPTLEGGLPNDPAIVQHSAASTSISNNAPAIGTQKPGPIGSAGTSSYGPIGSAAFSQATPGPPFPSSNIAPQPPNTSPVMDILNHNSGRSSPVHQSGRESKSPINMEGKPSNRGRGGGGQSGFYRGGRGRGMNQGGNQGYRGGRGRGGFQPGRPTSWKKEPLKFEGEYDFDKANEEFKEVLEKLQKSSIESKANGETSETTEVPVSTSTELEEGEIETAAAASAASPGVGDEAPASYYDKKKSFFDSISCEATEKSKNAGRVGPGRDPKAEYKLNKETFGVAGNRGGRGYYNRRGGQGYRGGYYGGGGGQGYRGGYNHGGYNNSYNGRFARDGNNFRGGRGRGGYGGRGQYVGGNGGNRRNNRNQD